ncbi:uncharacterized protein EI90DRAFT_3040914 [Cantharellus anzutake]|uniref:uncharacterized protein n=1 Tax=Cantharellus anzutake TaxID=1750568 RepID=UPI001908D8CB|nr:uncharacterized protein EI90DRAFT_3040914 [Cantharellus anzutake]KAF8337879.1 hypothetical protein EI90DRAFT_3040914 [Cantharellus anzutake]
MSFGVIVSNSKSFRFTTFDFGTFKITRSNSLFPHSPSEGVRDFFESDYEAPQNTRLLAILSPDERLPSSSSFPKADADYERRNSAMTIPLESRAGMNGRSNDVVDQRVLRTRSLSHDLPEMSLRSSPMPQLKPIAPLRLRSRRARGQLGGEVNPPEESFAPSVTARGLQSRRPAVLGGILEAPARRLSRAESSHPFI